MGKPDSRPQEKLVHLTEQGGKKGTEDLRQQAGGIAVPNREDKKEKKRKDCTQRGETIKATQKAAAVILEPSSGHGRGPLQKKKRS